MSVLSVDNISPIGSGTSVTVNSAATLVLTNANSSGVITATSFVGSGANLTSLPAQATIANNADNRIITGGSGVNLNAEANLTFNGNTLSVTGTTNLYGNGGASAVWGNTGYTGHLTYDGSNNAVIRAASGKALIFQTDHVNERLRIDSNGRIIMGSSSNTAFATAQAYRLFQIGQADGGWINLARTVTPADGNHLGAIQGFAKGADGTYHDTVAIDFKADGTPSNTSKPSKIEFYTTKSGTTSKAIAATLQADGRSEVFVQNRQFDIYSTGSGEQHSLRLLNSDATAGNEIGIYFGPANNVAGAYISGYAYGDFASTANRDCGLRFGVRQNGTFKECVRINDGGFFQATNIENSYETHTFAADLGHQFNSNQRYKTTLWLRNTNTNFENGMFRCAADRGASTSYQFITCTSGDLSDDEFRVRGDGNVYADQSFNANGADYAEYFEWADGNSSNEDRIGMTVVLDGNKIKVATSSDSTDNIIGVVSGSPSIIGDGSWNKWSGKYQKDDYNQYILDSEGHRQLNPSYDDTKTYTPRAERKEWDAIGMVGKLRIVKGQKTGTRWIKMRDISATVEEWLVR